MDVYCFILVFSTFLTNAEIQTGCFERWHQYKFSDKMSALNVTGIVDCLGFCLNNSSCMSVDYAKHGKFCYVNLDGYTDTQRKIKLLNDHYRKYMECNVAERDCLKDYPDKSYVTLVTPHRTVYGVKTQDECVTVCRMSANCWGVEWNAKKSHCYFWDTKPLLPKHKSKRTYLVKKKEKCSRLITGSTSTTTAAAESTSRKVCTLRTQQTVNSEQHERLYRYSGEGYYLSTNMHYTSCFVCFPAVSKIHCSVKCSNTEQCSQFTFHEEVSECCIGLVQ